MAMDILPCFKAYDIRGKVPEELNPELAVKIGRSFAAVYGLKKVVVGRDIRFSSEDLVRALSSGLQDMGVEVLDLAIENRLDRQGRPRRANDLPDDADLFAEGVLGHRLRPNACPLSGLGVEGERFRCQGNGS